MESMTYEEYQTWIAFYQIEPFGSPREDYRSGQICATAVNLMSGSGKDSKNYVATDFIPTFDSIEEEKRKQTVEAMNNGLGSAFAALKAVATNRKQKR